MIFRYGWSVLVLLAGCSQVLGIEELSDRESVDASGQDVDVPGTDAPAPDAAVWDAAPVDALPPGIYDHGWPEEFEDHIGIPADEILAFPVTIPHDGQVVGWGVIPHMADPQAMVRMALYTRANYGPGQLVTASPAWRVRDRQAEVDGDMISAGRYWLAISADTRFQIRHTNYQAPRDHLCFRDLPFDEPIPADFGDPHCFPRYPANMYITLETH